MFEVRLLVCPKCQSQMPIITIITDYAVVDRIINYLMLAFVAERPQPAQIAYQELLAPAESSADYFSLFFDNLKGEVRRRSGIFLPLCGW